MLIQFSSVVQSYPTLCDPMDCTTPGLPVHHKLLELAQTHVHQVGDAIQPSHPQSSPSPPAINLSQHQGVFQWVSSLHQVAKVLEFQHQSFQTIFRVEAQTYQKERPVQPLVWQRQRKTQRRMCGRGRRLCSVRLTGVGTGSATIGAMWFFFLFPSATLHEKSQWSLMF